MPLTAQALIDSARLRHWTFTDTALGDGAAVLFLNQRLRTRLLRCRNALRALANATMQTAAVVSGALVGVDAFGVPSYINTVGVGFPVHLDAGGIPYVDATETPISLDPFGSRGGTPGFPLPTDALAIFTCTATFLDGTSGEVDVVDEARRHAGAPGHNAAAFISGNRLVPIRAFGTGLADVWSSVTAVTTSYLPLTTIAALSDAIALPAALCEALVADLCELFAMQSPTCPKQDRAEFLAAVRRAELELDAGALDIIGDLQVSSVIYEG